MNKGVCLKSFRWIVNMQNAVTLCKLRYHPELEDHYFVQLDGHTSDSFRWTLSQVRYIQCHGEAAWAKTPRARGYEHYRVTRLIN